MCTLFAAYQSLVLLCRVSMSNACISESGPARWKHNRRSESGLQHDDRPPGQGVSYPCPEPYILQYMLSIARGTFRRTMATVAGNGSNISFTAEGAVSISYDSLVSSPLSLTASIGRCLTKSCTEMRSPTLRHTQRKRLAPNQIVWALLSFAICRPHTLQLEKGYFASHTASPTWTPILGKAMRTRRAGIGEVEIKLSPCLK